MSDLNTVLDATRSAVTDLIEAGKKTGAAWTTPRAPGKWSPSQIVEHVARSLEESANEVAGAPSKFPTLPVFIRPMLRMMFFNRVLKKQGFPKARTSRSMNPASGPATTAEGRVRLETALARFERECRLRASRGEHVPSTLFGPVSVEDYARFQEIHTRHHLRQMPAVAASQLNDAPMLTNR